MLNNFSIKTRLILLISFMAVLAVMLGALGLFGIKKANEGLLAVYRQRTVPIEQIGAVRAKLLANRLAIVNSLASIEEAPDLLQQIDKNIFDINQVWDAYLNIPLAAEEKRLADKIGKGHKRLVIEGLKPTLALLSAGNREAAKIAVREHIPPLFASISEALDTLTKIQLDAAEQEYDAAQRRYELISIISISALALGLLLSGFIGCTLIRGLSRSLQATQKIADAIAAGDLGSPIDTGRKDEFGALLSAMKAMQDTLKVFVADLDVMAQKHAEGWVKEQLNVPKFPGIYGKMAQEINELIQSRIAINRKLIGIVNQYAKGDFSLDMDVLPGETIAITKIMDNAKKTFLDVNNEIKLLVEAGAKGDFSKRSDAGRFEFMFKGILTDLNKLVETCDVGFNDVLRVANALARGDLTQTITQDYPGLFGRTRDGINDTIDNLKALVGEIKEASDTISTAAREIAAGNNDLSYRTEEQAASLEQTAASMDELTSTVQANTQSAEQASRLAVAASDIAAKGVGAVGQVILTMDDINRYSVKIGDIISVIDDIAFQTNILALNAAVEAARAGDTGKGFAVVAIEVRNLAQRAATAAGEIKALIHDSVGKAQDGGKLVVQAGHTMEEIVNAIRDVTLIVAEIAAASSEQSAGIGQVNQAVVQMDDMTQQNAALVEQAAAAAQSLETQTQHLSGAVANFKLQIHASDPGNFFNASPIPVTAIAKAKVNRHLPPARNQPKRQALLITSDGDEWDEF